jgi:hypothetical protein
MHRCQMRANSLRHHHDEAAVIQIQPITAANKLIRKQTGCRLQGQGQVRESGTLAAEGVNQVLIMRRFCTPYLQHSQLICCTLHLGFLFLRLMRRIEPA